MSTPFCSPVTTIAVLGTCDIEIKKEINMLLFTILVAVHLMLDMLSILLRYMAGFGHKIICYKFKI